jgi:hypothetical protein
MNNSPSMIANLMSSIVCIPQFLNHIRIIDTSPVVAIDEECPFSICSVQKRYKSRLVFLWTVIECNRECVRGHAVSIHLLYTEIESIPERVRYLKCKFRMHVRTCKRRKMMIDKKVFTVSVCVPSAPVAHLLLPIRPTHSMPREAVVVVDRSGRDARGGRCSS